MDVCVGGLIAKFTIILARHPSAAFYGPSNGGTGAPSAVQKCFFHNFRLRPRDGKTTNGTAAQRALSEHTSPPQSLGVLRRRSPQPRQHTHPPCHTGVGGRHGGGGRRARRCVRVATRAMADTSQRVMAASARRARATVSRGTTLLSTGGFDRSDGRS